MFCDKNIDLMLNVMGEKVGNLLCVCVLHSLKQ